MLKSFSFKTIDDCYENIGFGSVSPLKVMNKLNEAYKKDNIEVKNEGISKVSSLRSNLVLNCLSQLLCSRRLIWSTHLCLKRS